MERLWSHWNLQLFADGGDGGAGGSAGAGTGDGGAGEGSTGDTGAQDAAAQYAANRSGRKQKPNPLANVQYGVSQAAEGDATAAGQDDAAQGTDQSQATTKPSFEDLIKGEYKADFEKQVKTILSGRLRGAQETRQQMDKVNQILPQLMQKYGLGEGATLDDLQKKVLDDDSLYEDEAAQMGVSTAVVRDMHRLERERDAAQQAQQQSIEDMRLWSHFEHLSRQAEQLRQVFPNFDLMAELNASPEFARLTSPDVNIPLETAYRAVHAREIESGAMAYGAQRAAKQVAASVKANQARPMENGMGGQANIVTKTDPSKLKKADIDEIARRLERGENITFS